MKHLSIPRVDSLKGVWKDSSYLYTSVMKEVRANSFKQRIGQLKVYSVSVVCKNQTSFCVTYSELGSVHMWDETVGLPPCNAGKY